MIMALIVPEESLATDRHTDRHRHRHRHTDSVSVIFLKVCFAKTKNKKSPIPPLYNFS